jgi:hypothetical protein
MPDDYKLWLIYNVALGAINSLLSLLLHRNWSIIMRGPKHEQEVGKGGMFKTERSVTRSGPMLQAPQLARVQRLPECIQAAVMSGAYISFGRTSDGAAILIRVLDGPDKLSTYCTSEAELDAAMGALADRYQEHMPQLP